MKALSAILALALVSVACSSEESGTSDGSLEPDADQLVVVIRVSGLSDESGAQAVRSRLEPVAGVEALEVDAETATVLLEQRFDGSNVAEAMKALESALTSPYGVDDFSIESHASTTIRFGR